MKVDQGKHANRGRAEAKAHGVAVGDLDRALAVVDERQHHALARALAAAGKQRHHAEDGHEGEGERKEAPHVRPRIVGRAGDVKR